MESSTNTDKCDGVADTSNNSDAIQTILPPDVGNQPSHQVESNVSLQTPKDTTHLQTLTSISDNSDHNIENSTSCTAMVEDVPHQQTLIGISDIMKCGTHDSPSTTEKVVEVLQQNKDTSETISSQSPEVKSFDAQKTLVDISDNPICETQNSEGNIEKVVETLQQNNETSNTNIDIKPTSATLSNIIADGVNTKSPEVIAPNPTNAPSLIENHSPKSNAVGNNTEQAQSSLSLLAQYDTDDSDDDVVEVPDTERYQNRCVEIDSDSSTSDVEFLSENRNPINLDFFDEDIEDDEDQDGNIRTSRQPKVKGELTLEDLPPIEDLHITVPEEECTELGKINSIVEQLVIVNALPGTVPLDLGTILFRDKGKQVLGEVFDVLGQVSDPLYCVRFNSNKDIVQKGIKVGEIVYVAPKTEHTQFIVLANLMKMRGSDASWENDIEPPPRYMDYSDDEEERSARRPNRKRQFSGSNFSGGRGSYFPGSPYRGSYSGRGGVRPVQPNHQGQGNYNIVGNSWHSNLYQGPIYNQPQYRPPMNSPGFIRSPYRPPPPPPTHFHQPPPVNPGLVINPYAVYPPPHVMQQNLFPPPNLHQPPPPPPQ